MFRSRICLAAVSLCLNALAVSATAQQPRLHLSDVTKSAGIAFEHYSPISPQRHLHLFMGSGLAWVDFDRDGWPDLYLCQGREWPEKPRPDPRHSNRLFHNRGDGTFEDVTFDAGLKNLTYSMGTAVGDYDNDGFPDIYVSSFGGNRFYHNNGDGTFTQRAAQLGIDDDRYGTSCTWADIDGDGDLDLYVANYLRLGRDRYPLCRATFGDVSYPAGCHPRYQRPVYDALYRNDGNGSFTDVTAKSGLKSGPPRQGLGVVAADLDRDGDIDFYVANDTVENQLWINQGNGTFRDEALLSGVAVNRFGRREASMGIAVGDVTGDGRLDLFVTSYFNETNTLYRNDGEVFTDVTDEFGLGAPSKQRLAFGASLLDIDNDGHLDLFVANGHVQTHLQKIGRNEPFKELPQFFHNRDGRRFIDVSTSAGTYFQKPVVGRGSAVADFDRDGRPDLAVLHLNGPATLLRNTTPGAGHALQLELVGTRGNRDGIGAVVTVMLGKRRLVRLRLGSSSYLSCDDGRLLIGIGSARQADRIAVRWPGGQSEVWLRVPADRLHRLIEGTGSVKVSRFPVTRPIQIGHARSVGPSAAHRAR